MALTTLLIALPGLSVRMDASVEVEQRVAHVLERLRPLDPVRVILFGSTARGEADTDSDLDMIVVAERVPERFSDRLADAYDLIDPTFALDILVYTPDEYARMLADANPLISAAERDGRVIHARPAA